MPTTTSTTLSRLATLALLLPALVYAEGGTSVIRPGGSDQRCVQPKHGSMADGTELVLGQCNGSTEQAFTVANGAIQVFKNMCVVAGSGNAEDTASIAKCNTDDKAQQWTYDSSSKTFQAATGACLSLPTGNVAVGEPVGTGQCAAGDKVQIWKMNDATKPPVVDIPVAPPNETTPPTESDGPEGPGGDNKPPHSDDTSAPPSGNGPSPPTDTDSPQPTASEPPHTHPPHTGDGDGTGAGVTIRTNNMCLTATANKDGAAVVTSPCTPGDESELWTVGKKGNVVTLRVFGDKCLDVTEGKNEAGTAMQLWTCVDGGSNQSFEQKGGQLVWHFFNKCLGDKLGKVQIDNCSNDPMQTWTIL